MLNTRSIQGALVLIASLFLAIWLGLSIVTNQFETILQVLSAIVLIGCLFMGRRIWLLIPFAAAAGIGLRIPGNPSALLLAQVLVIGFSLLHLLMRKLPYRFKWTELEFWTVVLTLFIVQAYVRNPVGMNIFGGATVGGKPYAIFFLSLVGSLLLAGLKVPANQLKWILPLSICGGIVNLGISILGKLFPVVAYYTGASFNRADEVGYESKAIDEGAATRIGGADSLGKNLSLWISSYISPIRAFISPLWGFLMLISVAAAMVGGFRNGVIAVGLTYLVGIAYRSGLNGVILSLFAGFSGFVLLTLVNLIHPLPPNVQRSLSFLPGTWEQRYIDDTKTSTEWRVEMWKEALTSERWIRNKWMGDGLGFSAEDFQKSFTLTEKSARSGFDIHREQAMINGDYHSGPVSTIRTIGYFGLVVFLIAQVRLAVRAHRQIKRSQGTEWYPLALFLGIPMIWAPPFFVLVFGAFANNIISYLLSYSLLRLFENNVPLPVYSVGRRIPYVLMSNQRERRSPLIKKQNA